MTTEEIPLPSSPYLGLIHRLQYRTPVAWAKNAIEDLDYFLADHASCERKASATCLSFVVKFPDKTELIDSMISLAREELEHFHQVYVLLQKRGKNLLPDEKDDYVNLLMKNLRVGSSERFLDRLILSSIIEARGCERFGLIAEVLQDTELKTFYQKLAKAELRHNEVFLEHAYTYFPKELVESRVEELLKIEAKIIEALPWRHILH